jgi:hypothetical protein
MFPLLLDSLMGIIYLSVYKGLDPLTEKFDMGKAYDLQFHLAPYSGSVGTMVCGQCGKSIDPQNHDFREAKKPDPEEGWGFVVHHRECMSDQNGFIKAEKVHTDHANRQRQLLDAAKAFRKEWRVDDLDGLIESLQGD